jgi:hypothetical protein
LHLLLFLDLLVLNLVLLDLLPFGFLFLNLLLLSGGLGGLRIEEELLDTLCELVGDVESSVAPTLARVPTGFATAAF